MTKWPARVAAAHAWLSSAWGLPGYTVHACPTHTIYVQCTVLAGGLNCMGPMNIVSCPRNNGRHPHHLLPLTVTILNCLLSHIPSTKEPCSWPVQACMLYATVQITID